MESIFFYIKASSQKLDLPSIFGLIERSWGEVKPMGIFSEIEPNIYAWTLPAECAKI